MHKDGDPSTPRAHGATQLPPSPPPLPLLGNLLDVGFAGTPWNLVGAPNHRHAPRVGDVARRTRCSGWHMAEVVVQ
jgi:hypothetical protein